MNLRGKFTTDAQGHFGFRSVKPAGYPIPVDGPVGDLLRAGKRHNFRPAHLHFLILKDGFKTLISQIYDPTDDKLETDAQFGVTRALIGDYVRHDGPGAGAGREGRVVFARPDLRHGAGREQTAEAADRISRRSRQAARKIAQSWDRPASAVDLAAAPVFLVPHERNAL